MLAHLSAFLVTGLSAYLQDSFAVVPGLGWRGKELISQFWGMFFQFFPWFPEGYILWWLLAVVADLLLLLLAL